MKDEYDKTALETVIGNAVVGYLWPDEADDGLQPSPQGVRAAVKQALRSRLAEPDEMDGYQSCGPDGPEGHDVIPRKPEPAQVAPNEEEPNLDWLEADLSIYRAWTSQYQYEIDRKRAELAHEIYDRIFRAALASERAKGEGPSCASCRWSHGDDCERPVSMRFCEPPEYPAYEPMRASPAPGATALREALRWFAGEMERKLKVNDHKGGWDNCDPAYLMGCLYDEVDELRDCPDDDLQGHIDEAADIANYAMMLADQARALLRSEPREGERG